MSEFDKQAAGTKAQCHLETLLKGTFSLLAVKYPRSALRLSSLNVTLFLKLFERYYFSSAEPNPDFKKLYDYLFKTMQGILIYAKDGQHDMLFKEEGMISQL